MNFTPENAFSDLPTALLDEVLERTDGIGTALLSDFHARRAQREQRREQLRREKLLAHESDYPAVAIPTSCGVDGSYQIERLLAMDFIAVSAVAVEGLTPPSEDRHWNDPQHQTLVEIEAHDERSGSIIQAMTFGLELVLATQAPHEAIFLDGSFLNPAIRFDQTLRHLPPLLHLHFASHLLARSEEFLTAYRTVLTAPRSDRYFVAVPKYTINREIGSRFGWSVGQNDRSYLTDLLDPGELTRPIPLQEHGKRWNWQQLALISPAVAKLAEEVTGLLPHIQVVYYRPHRLIPALRLEMSPGIAHTPHRLAAVLQAIRHQTGSPAILEPYPLYMADRMVQSLGRAMPAFRQVTSQRMAADYEGNAGDIYLAMHAYRSERGRG